MSFLELCQVSKIYGEAPPTARQRQAGQATAASIAASLGTRDVLPLNAAVAPTDVMLEQVGAQYGNFTLPSA